MTGKIKNIILLAAVWVVLVLSVSVFIMLNTINTTGFTAENKVAKDSDYIYVTENSKYHGLIWKLDKEGNVCGFFSTSKLKYLEDFRVKEIAVADGLPRCVFEKKYDDNGRFVTEYAIAIFNDDMQPTFITAPFRFDQELILTGFTSTEDRFHLTAIPVSRKTIYVYRLYAADMKQLEDTKLTNQDVQAWEKDLIKVSSIEQHNAETGRFVAEAEYDEAELHIRYDNTMPEYFSLDTEAGNLFNRFKPNMYQYSQMSAVNINLSVIVAGIGALVILLLYVLFQNRNRIVYVVFSMEVLFIIALAVIFGYHVYTLEKSMASEHVRHSAEDIISTFDGYSFTDLKSQEIYTSKDYAVIAQRQNRMISTEITIDDEPDITDVLVADQNGKIIISGDGRNFNSVTSLYGTDVRELVYTTASTAQILDEKIVLDGEFYYAIATPLSKAGLNEYVGLIMARYDTIDKYFWKEYGVLLIIFVILFLISSIVLILVNIAQHKDLEVLAEALGKLSEGEEDIEKPVAIGRDMNYMWNSIHEIQKNILHSNRIKFLTYEAYFRFAPKGVEQILGRDSIMEVNLGDNIDLNGTIAFIASEKQEVLSPNDRRLLDKFMVLLHQTRQNYNGIFISHSNNLSKIKLLFMENNRETTGFGIDFLLKLREDRQDKFPDTTVIMHYTPLSYGVVGTEECSSIYMVSKESELLQDYAEWFRRKRVSLVLTESLIGHEKVDSELRYIGFIVPNPENPDERMKLYESFDAESVAIHSKRIATKEQFENALDMFYKQDFYLARNAFTEILRESSEDEISKWYLFECERYVNEVSSENFIGALHMD